MLASVLVASAAVFHGSPAVPTAIPWFVSLYEETATPICGGALIAPDRVLTAAHCVQGEPAGGFDVSIGGRSYGGRAIFFPTSYRLIPSPVRPLDYSASASVNDIAVILLREPATTVAPLPIAPTPPADGEPTMTVGRGYMNAQGDQPDAPLSANQQVLPSGDCARLYEQLLIPSRHLCTQDLTSTRAQACPGDSGSPVLVRRDGVLQLAGVVTWGGETQGKQCGQGPADVAERALPHWAAITGPPPRQFAPYGLEARVTRHGNRRTCGRGIWHPANAHFSYRWYRGRGIHKQLLQGSGRTHRSRRAISCTVTARTAGGWSELESYNAL